MATSFGHVGSSGPNSVGPTRRMSRRRPSGACSLRRRSRRRIVGASSAERLEESKNPRISLRVKGRPRSRRPRPPSGREGASRQGENPVAAAARQAEPRREPAGRSARKGDLVRRKLLSRQPACRSSNAFPQLHAALVRLHLQRSSPGVDDRRPLRRGPLVRGEVGDALDRRRDGAAARDRRSRACWSPRRLPFDRGRRTKTRPGGRPIHETDCRPAAERAHFTPHQPTRRGSRPHVSARRPEPGSPASPEATELAARRDGRRE